jgi:hypothetical protein
MLHDAFPCYRNPRSKLKTPTLELINGPKIKRRGDIPQQVLPGPGLDRQHCHQGAGRSLVGTSMYSMEAQPGLQGANNKVRRKAKAPYRIN